LSPPAFDADTFPEQLYLMAFGDIREAVRKGEFESGYSHYMAFGRTEIEAGRRHSPFIGGPPGLRHSILPPARPDEAVPPAPAPVGLPYSAHAIPYTPPRANADTGQSAPFSEALYLAVNPDVAALVAQGAFASGQAHWVTEGRAQEAAGLRPSITQDALYEESPKPGTACGVDVGPFDAESYFLLYPDVLKVLGKDANAARWHWAHHGRFEARVPCGLSPYRGWQARPAQFLAKPFGLNVFGPFAAVSGLGTAARGLLRAIESTGIPFELHAYDVSRASARITPAERARAPRYRCNLLLANADQIPHFVSLYPQGHFDDTYMIAVWA
jgi:hypothetical protein